MSSLLLRTARRAAGPHALARAAGPRATLRRRPLPTPPARHDSTTALVVAGIAVGAGGIAYKAAVHLSGQAEESLKAAREAAQKAAEERKKNPEPKKDGEKSSFATWFDSAGRRHYEGPFESPMTRREAALILGVRETATAKRIKDAHRRMTRINHPDLGGSAFLTAKVNEAKEMLMKGKGDE